MTTRETVHKMRAQILNLRSAGIACATAIHYFPPCGKPGGDHGQCLEARESMQLIFEAMKRMLLLARTALDAVFQRSPDSWDFMCNSVAEGTVESCLSEPAESLFDDQHEFIEYWGTLDNELAKQLGEKLQQGRMGSFVSRGSLAERAAIAAYYEHSDMH